MKVEARAAQLGVALAAVMFTFGASSSFAGDNDKHAGLVQQYHQLKTDTVALLDHVRHARLESRASDRKPILELRREVMDFCFDVRKHLHERDRTATVQGSAYQERSNLLGLAHSCEAMEKMLEAEFDLQRSADNRSDLLIRLLGKYEEVWKLADSEIAMPTNGLVTGRR